MILSRFPNPVYWRERKIFVLDAGCARLDSGWVSSIGKYIDEFESVKLNLFARHCGTELITALAGKRTALTGLHLCAQRRWIRSRATKSSFLTRSLPSRPPTPYRSRSHRRHAFDPRTISMPITLWRSIPWLGQVVDNRTEPRRSFRCILLRSSGRYGLSLTRNRRGPWRGHHRRRRRRRMAPNIGEASIGLARNTRRNAASSAFMATKVGITRPAKGSMLTTDDDAFCINVPSDCATTP